MIVAHPLTLTLFPEAGERAFLRLPFPLGAGWGEGAFPRIDAQSCYDVRCVPSFETVSSNPPPIETGSEPALPYREQFPKYVTVLMKSCTWCSIS